MCEEMGVFAPRLRARVTMDLEKQRRSLPIYSARDRLVREITSRSCCVVVGETGSGKTTQIPQYLYNAGVKGAIAVTQPRRVAAVSIAARVAEEQRVALGTRVGYTVRFDDCSSKETRIKYLTDGMLLREAMLDPLLIHYSVIILDEAHERTVNTDVLLGVVKRAQQSRNKKTLHIVIMSATLEAEAFSRYFGNACVLYVQGRQYPVNVFYTCKPQPDYLRAAITTVIQLHEEEGVGHILVFLTGQEEIEAAARILRRCIKLLPKERRNLQVCPLFAALPSAQQQLVFAKPPEGMRKVILSTNIAETSVTLPGVKHVIDTGLVKARSYNPRLGMDLLLVQPVSKGQARQRMGRAGREQAGTCYRLYTEESFEELQEHTVPEIKRCNLSGVILQLLTIGVSDILAFEFMDPPSEEAIVAALELLLLLGAVEKGAQLTLSPLGKQLSHFPLSPSLSRAILAAEEGGCCEQVVNIVAMLSVETIFYTPQDQRDHAVAVRRKFDTEEGDHVMLLKVYHAYKAAKGNKSWCSENYINFRSMKTVVETRRQLRDLCQRGGVNLTSSTDTNCIRRFLLAGLFTNLAEHVGNGRYQTVSSRQLVHIHPSSCLFHQRPYPAYLMFSELIHTSKCYMRTVSPVDHQWLFEVAPDYIMHHHSK